MAARPVPPGGEVMPERIIIKQTGRESVPFAGKKRLPAAQGMMRRWFGVEAFKNCCRVTGGWSRHGLR